jgi:hypothetical protein
MKRIIPLTVATAASVLLCIPSANATMYDTRAAWEAAVGLGNWTDVDLTGPLNSIAEFDSVNAVSLPSGMTLTFTPGLIAYQVGSGWGTWSGGLTPMVLSDPNLGAAVGGTASAPLYAFGLEMEPNNFGDFTMTLTLANNSTISQSVAGESGAAFFGWVGEPVIGFTVSAALDAGGFAFGRMVEGPGAPAPSEVPDSGSLVWLSGALWAGLAGLRQLRFRA